MPNAPVRILIVLAAAALLARCSADLPAAQVSSAPAADLRVRRGDFAETFLLSGELEAARGSVIAVPRLPTWQSTIKWMAAEGTQVEAGERVVELDASEFVEGIEQKRTDVLQAEHAISQKRSELAASLGERRYEVEQRKSDLAKARIDASVPADLIAKREFEDRRLALERAETEYAKARSTFEAARAKGDAELRNLGLTLSKAQRELKIAADAISTLTLTAPQPGIVVFNEHPWEGRKFQTGDGVFVGFPLAQIPDLSTLQVVGMLPDVDDGKIAAGMPVRLTIDAYPDRSYRGRVKEIAPVAQELGRGSLRRGFRVMIPLETVDRERMRPGLSVLVEVERFASKGVLLAPRAALNAGGKKARLVDGRVVDVQIGACNPQECVVTKGLGENARLAAWVVPGGGA
ncbi:MAG TPA: efflux RND transporter periplasmic adaptor subunit [Thermoanaerobaculia bacterium]